MGVQRDKNEDISKYDALRYLYTGQLLFVDRD